jgi:hypothetical protein
LILVEGVNPAIAPSRVQSEIAAESYAVWVYDFYATDINSLIDTDSDLSAEQIINAQRCFWVHFLKQGPSGDRTIPTFGQFDEGCNLIE